MELRGKDNDKFEAVIGLEIHAELATKSKMFCDSKNDPDETTPNKNVCPVCLGHPGTLPVPNKEAIKKVIIVGMALNGSIADDSQFDRKNYFYPDLPKGYQISQYEHPIVKGGRITLASGKVINITRVHLEEDTGSLAHSAEGASLVDFNRAGVPLMELVTEPDIRSAEEAEECAEELRMIFVAVGASRARMQKGEMRIEANVSVRERGAEKFGTKVELKNINSFRAVGRAIKYEIERQKKIIGGGGSVRQETRGWDDAKGETVLQRVKESSEDYRYFPEPDIPPLKLARLKRELEGFVPELPQAKRKRFSDEYGIDKDAVNVFVKHIEVGNFFEEAASELREWMGGDPKRLYKTLRNYMLTDLPRALDECKLLFTGMKATPENVAELIKMISKEEVSSRGAKDILSIMVRDGGDPSDIARDNNLLQTADLNIVSEVIDTVASANEKAFSDFKGGNANVLQFLIGQAMIEAKKKGASPNPKTLAELWNRKKGGNL